MEMNETVNPTVGTPRKKPSISVPPETQLATLSEFEAITRMHRSSIRRWIKLGRIKPVKLGTDPRAPLRFRLADIVALIERFANGTAE